MKIAALTCTRGNERQMFRPMLHRNISKQMNPKIVNHFIIDYPPASHKNDLYDRFKLGVKNAIDMGVDWLYVFEDDDYYSELHSGVLRPRAGVVMAGISSTVYYHIKQKSHRLQLHKGRASLFATAFNPAAMWGFFENKTAAKYLDVELWEYAKQNKLKTHLTDAGGSCTGIKHGVGLCGGAGHKSMAYAKDDMSLNYLRSRVDAEAMEFYKGLKL